MRFKLALNYKNHPISNHEMTNQVVLKLAERFPQGLIIVKSLT
ncbi:hypothetical protein LCUFL03_P20008 [Latilactobacillus curvatus]|nr:hypothetical protein LCUFL03_P20008 [Latilactobacillus curvatus]